MGSLRLNMDPKFVNEYFNTDYYKKKVYENPRLIKTTKYSLIYTCDNKKKLVIPKIYEGICETKNQKESSFAVRIIIRAVWVFVIALVIAIVDLAVGFSNNKAYVSNISDVRSKIEQELSDYGYSADGLNENRFTKETEAGDRTLAVSYGFDKYGNIAGVDIQLYYNADSENVEDELTYIISTINDEFDSKEVSDFIDLAQENLAGETKYGSLKSENYELTLSRSGGYVDINSY